MHRRSLVSSVFPLVLALVLVPLVSGCVSVKVEPPKTEAPKTTETPVKVGDTVAAPWGGAKYIGTVKAVKDGKADVLYADDQQVREIAFGELTVVEKKSWAVGDKVLAVWSSGKFYPGTVAEEKDAGVYSVKWDDGSPASDVEAGKIMTP